MIRKTISQNQLMKGCPESITIVTYGINRMATVRMIFTTSLRRALAFLYSLSVIITL
jgi:hypothetical protein